ncbi:MAG: iron-sulfur cluster assembly scaffold protein [Proteobacteria bacterium]|nr:iron-sulfur cluster assembly scaffold protein [Pseudomonadota bacterium]
MDIYREEFMEIYKNPMNMGVIEKPSILEHGVNESCGDEMDLYLKIEDNKIIDARFKATSCSVGVVSSAILTEEIRGMDLEEVKKLTKQRLLDLIGVNLTTSRIKCATLPLETLMKGIENYESIRK